MKTAKVCKKMNTDSDLRGPDTITTVELYDNNTLVGCIEASDKSIFYVNEIVENWQNGILKNDNGYIKKS